jgi:thymidylate synthase (FAD)
MFDSRSSEPRLTRRPVVDAVEARIGVIVPLYVTPEHPEGLGGVQVLDYMGSEQSLIHAARQSYQKGTRTLNDDRGLLRHLVRHKHSGPLEFAELAVQIRAPLTVARQIVRTRTANWSEESGRFSILEDVYIPPPERIQRTSAANKQGSGERFDEAEAALIRGHLQAGSTAAMLAYAEALDRGLARETARQVVPCGIMTTWCWKLDLHNICKTLGLRLAHDAQGEAQELARAIRDVVAVWMPNVWEAVQDYWLDALSFSGPELPLLRSIWDLLPSTDEADARAGVAMLVATDAAKAAGFSKGEAREFAEKVWRLLVP